MDFIKFTISPPLQRIGGQIRLKRKLTRYRGTNSVTAVLAAAVRVTTGEVDVPRGVAAELSRRPIPIRLNCRASHFFQYTIHLLNIQQDKVLLSHCWDVFVILQTNIRIKIFSQRFCVAFTIPVRYSSDKISFIPSFPLPQQVTQWHQSSLTSLVRRMT